MSIRPLLVVFLSFVCVGAAAAPIDIDVLFDSDDNPFSGCTVSGMTGVDHLFRTNFDTDTGRVTAVSGQRCTNGSLTAPQVLDAAGWPGSWDAITGEFVVDSRFPLSYFQPRAGSRMRLGIVMRSGSDTATLLLQGNGGPIMLLGVPARRRAANTPGRAEGDWTDLAPLVIGGSGQATLRFIEVFGFTSNQHIFFRVRGQKNPNAPTAADDSYSTTPGTPLAVGAPGILGNDTDPRGLPLTALLEGDVLHGMLVLNADGSFSYTDDGTGAQRDHFTYRADNGEQQSNIARVDIGIGTQPNRAPVTGDDAYEVPRGGTLEVIPPGVLGNDNDPDLDPIQAVLQTGPAAGSVALNPNGSFTYIHGGTTTTPDQFTYHATDGVENSRETTVHINIRANEPPVAVDDTYSVNEGGILSVPAPGVLANDTDPDATPLTASLVTSPTNGSVTLNSDGSFVYQHNGSETTSDQFTYQVSDGDATDVATVTITVFETNDAPVAANDTYTVAEDGVLNVAAPGVLGNDADPDSAVLTVSLVSGTTNGTLTLNANGSFTYTPNANFFGTDSFSYRASDGASLSNVATVTITVTAVNDPPSFTAGGNVTVNEDSGAYSAAWATAISAGPANEAGQTLTFNATNDNNALFSVQPAIAADGTLSFTPAANANGAATVTVTLSDNGIPPMTTAPVTFTITVSAANDPPSFTSGGNVTVNEDSGAYSAGWATSISAGPADESGQTVTFNATNDNNALFSAQPAISSAGVLMFTPAANANGSATVTVTASDNGVPPASSAAQTFTITVTPVNDPPSFASGGDVTSPEDTPYSAPWATAISAGPPNEAGQTLTFNATNNNNALFSVQPAIAADGTLTFTPAPNANGTAQVTVTLQDNGGGTDTSAPQMFTITITAVNDAPSFTSGGNVTVNEDSGAYSAGWATSISAGPPDESGQTVTFNATNNNNGLFSVQPAIAANGTLTFTPAPNGYGTAQVTVTLQDNGGGADTSAPQIFTITVDPVNDEPSFASGGNVNTNEDTPYNAAWATAISAGPNEVQTLTFVVTNNTNAALFASGPSIDASGILTFTPAANASGTADITVELRDNGGTLNGGDDTSAAVTFTITVNAVNDPPLAASQSVATDEDTPLLITLSASDVEGSPLTFLAGSPSNGVLGPLSAPSCAAGTCTVTTTYTPNADFNGPDSFTFTANDGTDTSNIATVTITVNAVNDGPVNTVPAGDWIVAEGTPLVFSAGNGNAVSVADIDAGTSAVQVTLQASSGHGTVTLSGTTNLTFTTGDGTADEVMTFTGTLADINAALEGMSFSSTLGYEGPATLTITSNDQGATGTGGALSDTDVINLTVQRPNDPPVNTVPGAQALNEDQSLTFSTGNGNAISISDPDAGAADVEVSLSVTNGTLTLSTVASLTFTAGANGTAAMTFEGSIANINAALAGMIYAPTADYNGSDTLTITTDDLGNTGTGGPLSDTDMVNITVNAVNDEPTFTAGGNVTVDEDSGAYNAGWATSISAGPANESTQILTFTVTNDNNPLFSAQPSISATGALTFTPAADAFGTATVTVFLQDDGGTANGGDDTSATVQFTITVNAVNDAPVAENKTHATHSAIGFSIIAASHTGELKENATDVDDAFGELTVQLFGTPTPANSTVSLINPADGSFYFEPPGGFTGAATFQFKVCDDNAGDPNQCSAAATVTINVGGTDLWFVDDTDAMGCGVNCNGARTKPLVGLNNAALAGRGTGDKIFAFSGTYNHGHTFNAGELLVGQASSGTFDGVFEISLPANGTFDTRPALGGAPATLQSTVTAATNSTLRGVAIDTAVTGFMASGATGMIVLESTVVSTGQAINISNASAGVTGVNFTTTTSTGGFTGIFLSNVTGTFNFGTGTLSGHAGVGSAAVRLLVIGGPSNIAIGGTITEAAGARAIHIGTLGSAGTGLNASNATVNITSTITGGGVAVYQSTAGTLNVSGTSKTFSTGTTNAVELQNNTGATINFSGGGLQITTTTGKGFTATGGGTVNVTTGANPNTIASTGGIALEVQNTTIGGSGMTWRSISANGGANGIVLINTGVSAALTVTGNSAGNCGGVADTNTGDTKVWTSIAANLADCTGGTIENTTGADGAIAGNGIYLDNTRRVSLTRMKFNGHSNHAIYGANVIGFTADNIYITGTNGTTTTFEGGITFTNLSGTGAEATSITNSTIEGGFHRNVSITNTSAITLHRVTFDNVTFGLNATNADDSLSIEALAGTLNATVNNSVFLGARGDVFQYSLQNSGAGDLIFNNNSVTNNHPNIGGGGGGVTINAGGTADMTYSVTNSLFRDSLGTGVLFSKGFGGGAGDATMSGTFQGNTIGNAAAAGSGSLEGSGIEFLVLGRGMNRAAIRNNEIYQYNDQGILLTAGGAPTSTTGLPVHDASFQLTIEGNTISNPYTVGAPAAGNNGIHLNGGTNSPDAYNICLSVGDAADVSKKNNIVNSGSESVATATDFRLRHRFADVTITLPGYAGGNTDTAAVTTYMQNRNNTGGAPSGNVTVVAPATGADGYVGGAACSLP